ncbi:MAG: sigma 54-interacting transcriptional regulator, partial [Flavobacterium sp.]
MDKIESMLKAMQEREKEHFLLLSLSNSFARCSNYNEFAALVNNELKNSLFFDFLAIGTTDQEEKKYQLFFHSDAKIDKASDGIDYDVNDCYFNEALQSADPVIVDFVLPPQKKITVPLFVTQTKALGMRELVIIPLEYHKNNPSVLFLFFKKSQIPDRNLMRLLKGLSLPIALAVSNILVMRKMESNDENIISSNTHKLNISESQNSDNSKIIGKSIAIQKIKTLIHQVASSDSGVLILGESGTGKEVVASEIHSNSARSEKPMIKVNCAAIPVNLIESELFGHEKGSFTGAIEK